MGEPKELKMKFDAIFEVEKFVKVMDGIKKCAKEFVISSLCNSLSLRLFRMGI